MIEAVEGEVLKQQALFGTYNLLKDTKHGTRKTYVLESVVRRVVAETSPAVSSITQLNLYY